MSTLIGKTVGKYALTERLGRGGMAEVYKAHHPKLNRTVAVKILHEYLAEGEDFLRRFEREARAVAILRHSHIVQIHDFDVDHETYYMVMEYFEGGTLQDRMAELVSSGKYMPLERVVEILKQIASALDYAHKKGVIHRDIKPSNILLNDQGEAFLADFGIARIVSTTQFTSTGALIGTPTYMSPEQSKGDDLTEVSDIYSLGVVLYELLTGKAPFTSDTPLAIIRKHISEPVPPPSSLRPGLPASVEAVVGKVLEKEPSLRYQSAGELARALEQALTTNQIAELDSEKMTEDKASLSQSTERVAGTPLPGWEHISAAMENENRAEINGEFMVPQITKPESESANNLLEKGSDIRPKKEKKPRRGKMPGVPGRVQQRRLKPIIITVILIAILSGVLITYFRIPRCYDLGGCLSLQAELENEGDLDGSLAILDKAIDMVEPQDREGFARLWCERASLLDRMGRLAEANESRRTCEAWHRTK